MSNTTCLIMCLAVLSRGAPRGRLGPPPGFDSWRRPAPAWRAIKQKKVRYVAPVLAIDQGTTSTRAIVFDASQRIIGVGQEEFTQHFPRSGWVEHDLEEIWQTTLSTIRAALADAKLEAGDIAAIGITNQRETVCLFERETGKARPPRRRLAGPAHGGDVQAARRRRPRADDHREDRPPHRPVFLRHQARLAPRRGGGSQGPAPRRARWCSAPSTPTSSPASPAVSSPTSPTPRARSSTTSAPAPGTTSSSTFSRCRGRCLRRCSPTRTISAPPIPPSSARRSRCAASRATSRLPSSATPALSPAW